MVAIRSTAYGAVEGVIESGDSAHVFIRDSVYGGIVECWASESWTPDPRPGLRIIVEGRVERYSDGTPRSVTDVVFTCTPPKGEPGGYKRARGALPTGGRDSVEIIREARDSR